MRQCIPSRLDEAHHPKPIVLPIRSLLRGAPAVERELRLRARHDVDRCCGYFPALAGTDGIVSDLPACRKFAAEVPQIVHAGTVYHFNFLRLSLVQQSCEPAFHLDTDADTAITGDVETLHRRQVRRLVLNLSPISRRTLHYLDVDVRSTRLEVHDGYVRVAGTEGLGGHEFTAVIPPRDEVSVHGLIFVSNRVLHSGVDDHSGHFIAAYGMETNEAAVGRGTVDSLVEDG
jgi:hypothetical protein